jgi:hypothetical protein
VRPRSRVQQVAKQEDAAKDEVAEPIKLELGGGSSKAEVDDLPTDPQPSVVAMEEAGSAGPKSSARGRTLTGTRPRPLP